ncbi:HAD family hydrolase [Ideonella sp. 4Y16]|uniref:HAD family hydrolase n=1 Tax=Ideonella alba TaxID=2824118 RepID=A0A940YC09_9BURK|nr:HAD family hydrolase [Ideonella alba]MBQ0932803.1 HAD family hydrolase [Ideonella alba]MBQ0945981.1 HAD family hydrolase [Ideonella alba]
MRLALFDLDGTLLPTDSDHAFGEFMCAIGWTDGQAWRARNQQFFEQYQAGTLVLADYVDFATSAWRHRPLADAEAARERFMQEVIGPALRFEAIELVRAHQQDGDLVAVVTATNEFVTRPIATAFGVETLLAVELERGADGRATGAIRGTPTFREGKVARVQAWLHSRGQSFADFDDVLFYSDSTNDLPLLEAVPTPVATNPTPALRQIALERGWRIIDLFDAT